MRVNLATHDNDDMEHTIHDNICKLFMIPFQFT
jgi:hypothetical protein